MFSRFCRLLPVAGLLWAGMPAAAAFSAGDFLTLIENGSSISDLESAIVLSQGDSKRKKELMSLKKRLAEEKRRIDNMIRELKPLAMSAQKKGDVNVRGADGCTLLMHAARYGNEMAIKMLMDAGADSALADKRGKTAMDYDLREGNGFLVAQLAQEMHAAVTRNDFDTVRKYCRAGLPVDTMLPDGPLVEVLLQAQQYPLVVELLDRVKPENIRLPSGALLSELIVTSRHPELLKKGAELYGKALWDTSAGGTDTLMCILTEGNLTAVQLYVHHHGVDNQLCALAVRHSSPAVITWVLQKAEAVAKEDAWGSFPLFEAARRGNLSVYEAVLAIGGDVNARNAAGETLLMHAALSGSEEMVNAVLQKMNAELVGAADAGGRTAADYAALSGSAGVESILASRGVQPAGKK